MNSTLPVKTSVFFAPHLVTDCEFRSCANLRAKQKPNLTAVRYNQLIPGIVMAVAFIQAKLLAAPLLLKLGAE